MKIKCTKFEVSTSITFEVMKIKQGNEMIFKMTLNDLEGQRTLSQNDLDNMKVKCTKFEVPTSITFELNDNLLKK